MSFSIKVSMRKRVFEFRTPICSCNMVGSRSKDCADGCGIGLYGTSCSSTDGCGRIKGGSGVTSGAAVFIRSFLMTRISSCRKARSSSCKRAWISACRRARISSFRRSPNVSRPRLLPIIQYRVPLVRAHRPLRRPSYVQSLHS